MIKQNKSEEFDPTIPSWVTIHAMMQDFHPESGVTIRYQTVEDRFEVSLRFARYARDGLVRKYLSRFRDSCILQGLIYQQDYHIIRLGTVQMIEEKYAAMLILELS